MPKLLIGTPCYNGQVTMQYMSSMLRLQQVLAQEKSEFSLAMTGSESLITRARNFIVSQFLGRPQFTHLLFIDADSTRAPVGLRTVASAGLPVSRRVRERSAG